VAALARLPVLGERGVLLALAALIALPVARNLWFGGLELYVIPVVPLAMVATGGLLVATRWLPKAALGLAAVLVVALTIFPLAAPPSPSAALAGTVWANPRYDLAIGNLGRDGLDMQELAVELIDALPKWADDPGTLLFWYQSGDGILIDSIQSTYLWRSNAVQGFDFPAMPALNDQQRSILSNRPPRHIALLDATPEQVRAGRDALASIGLVPISAKDTVLEAGAWTVYLEVLTFEAASCDQERHKLEDWIVSMHASVRLIAESRRPPKARRMTRPRRQPTLDLLLVSRVPSRPRRP
jgi:hypothetical protein